MRAAPGSSIDGVSNLQAKIAFSRVFDVRTPQKVAVPARNLAFSGNLLPFAVVEMLNVCPNSPPFYRMKSLLPAVRRRKQDPSDFEPTSFIMKIHEYQAKAILKKYGVSVPRGAMAASQDEAEAVARELFNSGASGVVVKAQIHAGGRGKGGGVKIAKSVNEAGDLASKMLGMKLVTHQTGSEGRIVRRLLIEETLPIEKELYLGILVDRAEARSVFMASVAGGLESEEV